MASTERTVKVRYIVVDTRKGVDLMVRHDLKDALSDCDAMFHTHIRREVEISWDNVTVISRSVLHIATLTTNNEWAHGKCPSCGKETHIHEGYGACHACIHGV